MSVELQREANPFADALRSAIQARGLGLDRIRERLRTRGVSVSLATLSYWQSGRSRPERKESLIALAHLEAVLDLPDGELARRLGPRRPRGRRLFATARKIASFWPHPQQVEEAVREVDVRWDDRLTRISQHDRVIVGADRGERSYWSRQVLRAEADGPDRWVAILHIDEHDRPAPEVLPLRHCSLGRTVTRPAEGLVVAELMFGRTLARGETVITEHELRHSAPYPVDANYERKFRLPTREYVLEVSFDPAALPTRCEWYTITEDGSTDTVAVELDESHSVHGVALNVQPGCVGFRWYWS